MHEKLWQRRLPLHHCPHLFNFRGRSTQHSCYERLIKPDSSALMVLNKKERLAPERAFVTYQKLVGKVDWIGQFAHSTRTKLVTEQVRSQLLLNQTVSAYDSDMMYRSSTSHRTTATRLSSCPVGLFADSRKPVNREFLCLL